MKHILTVLFLTGLLTSCSSKEPYVYTCQDGLNEFQEVKTLRFFQNIDEQDTLVTLVIRSQSAYEKYIRERPLYIDFSKQTLLGGRFLALSMDYVSAQTLTGNCAANELYYDVKLEPGAGQAYSTVPFFILVPKIPEDKKVQFAVHY
jgi:hypothetical protein